MLTRGAVTVYILSVQRVLKSTTESLPLEEYASPFMLGVELILVYASAYYTSWRQHEQGIVAEKGGSSARSTSCELRTTERETRMWSVHDMRSLSWNTRVILLKAAIHILYPQYSLPVLYRCRLS